MNYLNAINFGSSMLKKSSLKSHLLESELLLAESLNSNRENILIKLDKKIDVKNYYYFKKLLARRKRKEPIAQILKKKELLTS